MNVEPTREHRWLDRLVGGWSFEGECNMGPGQPPMKNQGAEVVRSIGGLWTIGDGEWEMPDGAMARSVMTLGYDPKAGCFVGTFVASMMTHLWIYTDGSLDEAGKVLTLSAEGPGVVGEGTGTYRDRIEFVDDDHRILTSHFLGEGGEWHLFMTAHYRRRA